MIKKRDFTKFSLLMLLATASVVQLHAMRGVAEGPAKGRVEGKAPSSNGKAPQLSPREIAAKNAVQRNNASKDYRANNGKDLGLDSLFNSEKPEQVDAQDYRANNNEGLAIDSLFTPQTMSQRASIAANRLGNQIASGARSIGESATSSVNYLGNKASNFSKSFQENLGEQMGKVSVDAPISDTMPLFSEEAPVNIKRTSYQRAKSAVNSTTSAIYNTPGALAKTLGGQGDFITGKTGSLRSTVYDAPGRAVNAMGGKQNFMSNARTSIRNLAVDANKPAEGPLLTPESKPSFPNKSYSNLSVRALNKTLSAIENLPNNAAGRLSAAKATVMSWFKAADVKPEEMTAEADAMLKESVQDVSANAENPTEAAQTMWSRLTNMFSNNSNSKTATAVEIVENASSVENPLQQQAKKINARLKDGNVDIARQANLQQSVQSNNNPIIIV